MCVPFIPSHQNSSNSLPHTGPFQQRDGEYPQMLCFNLRPAWGNDLRSTTTVYCWVSDLGCSLVENGAKGVNVQLFVVHSVLQIDGMRWRVRSSSPTSVRVLRPSTKATLRLPWTMCHRTIVGIHSFLRRRPSLCDG